MIFSKILNPFVPAILIFFFYYQPFMQILPLKRPPLKKPSLEMNMEKNTFKKGTHFHFFFVARQMGFMIFALQLVKRFYWICQQGDGRCGRGGGGGALNWP